MHLVPIPEIVGGHADPSNWVAIEIISDLEAMAEEYRESAKRYRGRMPDRSRHAIAMLNQAAETCDDIIEMIRTEYLSGSSVARH